MPPAHGACAFRLLGDRGLRGGSLPPAHDSGGTGPALCPLSPMCHDPRPHPAVQVSFHSLNKTSLDGGVRLLKVRTSFEGGASG